MDFLKEPAIIENTNNVESVLPQVELTKFKLVDLFAGTGAFTHAFELTNKVKCVYANDMRMICE
jgi:tRNA G37 N-methylase Trm5